MSDENQQNIVDEHRKMVVMTGNLSEFQLKNMKAWPFIIFDDLSKVEINYDFTNIVEVDKELEEAISAGSIEYDFYFKKEPPDPDLRLAQLILWTKYMFWEDTDVTFKKQGQAWKTNLNQ